MPNPNNDLTAQEDFSLVNQSVERYLKAVTEEEQIRTLQAAITKEGQPQKRLEWKGSIKEKYHVDLSKHRDFSVHKRFLAMGNALTLPGILIPGTTYYWRVFNDKGEALGGINRFRTSDATSVRMISMDGLFNMRDLGGWEARNQKRIPYGRLYRGGNFLFLTPLGKQILIEDLGIKTEIDLRADGKREFNDSRVEYFKAGMGQYTYIIPGFIIKGASDMPSLVREYDPLLTSSLKRIFEKLAIPSSYPVYFHCNAGADRTGTLAFLLEGLLGVSYADMIKDFELTSFSSQGARYRSALKNEISFDDSGIFENSTGNLIAFGKMHDLIMANYLAADGTLLSSIRRYLMEVPKISEATLEAVRENILGEGIAFEPIKLKD